ncbi:S-methyl-5'-thioadenosine phosphorylase [Marinicauda algicola]|uniref:S-methyl-5'-thioadenosine phosphorylase n=1 Tax=Marinicauda algicola TaxID=2029849 RepID=A0A4S2GXJ7_9PROT|nr:S-methyl-5'-thioadenosine phosphorylase [Marinicauda algicola]TGY87581.1 S-methyl-5'-thioadenosine phosphorylase [Marinicauda algicola]
MSGWTLGIIGGSGLYRLEGLEDVRTERVFTPWGEPSAPLVKARLNGVDLVFLSRHDAGHRIPPGDINYRANIDAMKRAGVTDLLSLSACGSLREELAPGAFVVVDQYVDRTFAREKSFFGPGCVAHVSMARPVCSRLSAMAVAAAKAAGVETVAPRGTYLAMEGPQFSTKAESHLYRSWGMDVIGMTNMPEAKLAREAELPYASVAMVTDYDCWKDDLAEVDITDVLAVLKGNVARAQDLVRAITRAMAAHPRTPSPDGIETVLDTAILTAPDARDPALVAKLDAVAGRVLGQTTQK